MLNDNIFRQFQSLPVQEQFHRSQESVQLRQTLLINEIFKCGKDIFGQTNQNEEQNIQRPISHLADSYQKRSSSQKKKYIYEYAYGKNKNYHQTLTGLIDEYSTDQISFTLSNQDNPRNSSKQSHFSGKASNNQKDQNRHIIWKADIVENHHFKDQPKQTQYISEIVSNKFSRSISNQKIGKWKKPTNPKQNIIHKIQNQRSKISSPQKIQTQSPIKIKDHVNRKTFDLSGGKLNYFPDTVKKRKAIFQQKDNKKVNQFQSLNYSSYHPDQKIFTFKTPQKTIAKRPQIPLSQQITKNVYSRLKQQVAGNSFIKEFQFQQKKTQEESQSIWKGFINRSDKWIERKKSNLVERQAMQKYIPNFQPIKQKEVQKGANSPPKQYFSYAEMKSLQKKSRNNLKMKFQQRKFQPQFTFKTKNNQKSSKSPKKKQSSVQNCINKLKTQTQLLKVKLLSPLRNKSIEDDEILNHYKQLNQSESKKLVRKFSSKQQNELNKILKDHNNFSQLRSFYGKCIKDKYQTKQIQRYS